MVPIHILFFVCFLSDYPFYAPNSYLLHNTHSPSYFASPFSICQVPDKDVLSF